MKLTTSHTYVYKKLDEFGKDYNKVILDSVQRQGQLMEQQAHVAVDNGRKLVFDNIDYRHEVHYMTEEHQNPDNHCVTVMAVENRVSGQHLSDQQPQDGVRQLENGKCLPSTRDNIKQRDNYIVLVGRVIATHVKYLNFLRDVAVDHIPHLYRKEMSKKSEMVSSILGMLSLISNSIHVLIIRA